MYNKIQNQGFNILDKGFNISLITMVLGKKRTGKKRTGNEAISPSRFSIPSFTMCIVLLFYHPQISA